MFEWIQTTLETIILCKIYIQRPQENINFLRGGISSWEKCAMQRGCSSGSLCELYQASLPPEVKPNKEENSLCLDNLSDWLPIVTNGLFNVFSTCFRESVQRKWNRLWKKPQLLPSLKQLPPLVSTKCCSYWWSHSIAKADSIDLQW